MADNEIRVPLEVIFEPEPEENRINRRLAFVRDITPLASETEIEVARQTHAVPAEERTKRSKEQTERSRELTKRVQSDGIARMGFGGTLAVVACVALHDHPGPLATALGIIAGIFGGKPLIEAIKKKPE